MQGNKYCGGCTRLLSIEYFSKDKHKKDGYCSRCKACQATTNRLRRSGTIKSRSTKSQQGFEDKRQRRKEYMSEYGPTYARSDKNKQNRRNIRDTNRLRAFGYLGNMCAICQETDLDVLQFDHIEPIGKYATRIYHFLRGSWEKLEQELQSCQLLCANCHVKKTRRDRGLPSLNKYRDISWEG